MSRAHGLDLRLRLQGVNHENVLESERVLGGLFEAYIAGVYKEYGNAGFAALYAWFAWWMRPYFVEISTQLRSTPPAPPPHYPHHVLGKAWLTARKRIGPARVLDAEPLARFETARVRRCAPTTAAGV